MEFEEGMTICVSGWLHYWFAEHASNVIRDEFPGRPDLAEEAKQLSDTDGVKLDHQDLYVEAVAIDCPVEDYIVFRHPDKAGVFLSSRRLAEQYFTTIHSMIPKINIQEKDLLAVLEA